MSRRAGYPALLTLALIASSAVAEAGARDRYRAFTARHVPWSKAARAARAAVAPDATLHPAAPAAPAEAAPMPAEPARVERRAAKPAAPEVTPASALSAAQRARRARRTPEFDGLFAAAKVEIEALHADGQVAAARNAAVDALMAYLDHHPEKHTGNFRASQIFFVQEYAREAGLLKYLGNVADLL